MEIRLTRRHQDTKARSHKEASGIPQRHLPETSLRLRVPAGSNSLPPTRTNPRTLPSDPSAKSADAADHRERGLKPQISQISQIQQEPEKDAERAPSNLRNRRNLRLSQLVFLRIQTIREIHLIRRPPTPSVSSVVNLPAVRMHENGGDQTHTKTPRHEGTKPQRSVRDSSETSSGNIPAPPRPCGIQLPTPNPDQPQNPPLRSICEICAICGCPPSEL